MTTPMPSPSAEGTERFGMRQRLTMMVNRYEFHHLDEAGQEAGLFAFAEQKRMALKEQVSIYADAEKTRLLCAFKARTVMDLGATYDVTDENGVAIGWFRKQFAKSLVRSTWQVGTVDGLTATGQERNPTVAVLRRVWEFVPIVGEIPVPFLFHFDFVGPDGQVVMSRVRRPALRDVYEISLPHVGGRRIDRRMALAIAVALDALQSR